MTKRLSIITLFVSLTTLGWSQMLVDDFGFFAGSPDADFGILAVFQGKKTESPTVPELHPFYKVEVFYQHHKNIWSTRLAANVSPISVNFQMGLFCTPRDLWGIRLSIPFTLTVGTGWYDTLFGYGIGVASNFYDAGNINNTYVQENFTKVYFNALLGTQISGTIIPNLLVWTIDQSLSYRYFLGTKSDNDVWIYENQGDNLKYSRYSVGGMVTFVLPLLLRRISLFAQGDWDIQRYNQSPAAQGGWGSDLPRAQIGAVFGAGHKGFSIDLQLAWGNVPAYQDGHGYNLILTARRINTAIIQYWYLNKIALMASWEI